MLELTGISEVLQQQRRLHLLGLHPVTVLAEMLLSQPLLVQLQPPQLEKYESRAGRVLRMQGLENLPWEERLEVLGLFSLGRTWGKPQFMST